MKRFVVILFFIFGFSIQSGFSQKLAIKSNILSDVTTTMNLGVELPLNYHWTIDLSGGYNPWTFSNGTRWKHWTLQPEVRYYLCMKMAGHFFAAHLLGGEHNIGNIDNNISFLGTDFSKFSDRRYQGWFVGGGVAYGYAWMLNRHWNFEAELGVGVIYSESDSYRCAKCGRAIEENEGHVYYGPTKVALNLVYTF